MRCIICGEDKQASKEHIIPEALGNKEFVIYNVCKECNEKLGANVDSYITNHILIKIKRKSFGLTGKDNKEVKIFPSTMKDIKGNKYFFRYDEPTIEPKISLSGDILHVEADTVENGKEFAKKKLRRRGKSESEIDNILENITIGERRSYTPEFIMPADINLARYLLAGIKIAYEYAYKILGDIYYEDEIAKQLRNILKNAVDSEKETLDDVIDYNSIKQYASLLQKGSKEIRDKIYPIVKNLKPPARHLCLLHGSKNNEVICEAFLLLEDIISYTVLISRDASQFSTNELCSVAIVLENGKCIE